VSEQNNSLLTKEEVAEYLNMTDRTILDWAQRGVIPAFKIAGSWRFRQNDIDKWIESQRTGPTSENSKNSSIQPKSFRSIEHEGEILNCVNAILKSMEDTDREVWVVANFSTEYGDDIAKEAIKRLSNQKILRQKTQKINGNDIVILERKR
jgi:excisionase family DNA binding protein